MKTKIQIMAVCLLSLVFVVSCNKYDDDLVVDETMSQKLAQENPEVQVMGTSSTVINIAPSSGYTPYSNVTIPAHKGQSVAVGGVIRAKMLYKIGSSNSFKIEISKEDNTNFTTPGTALVRIKSTSGTIATGSSVTLPLGQKKVETTITGTFDQGIMHFYPMVESSTGTRYYAEPFMMYTSPMYNIKSSYSTYEEIGRANDVVVQAAGLNLINVTDPPIYEVQCTEFCHRYYTNVYGKNTVQPGTINGGHAKTWYGNYLVKGLTQIPNGTAPRVGDILCMDNYPSASNKYGHVAIVIEVVNGTNGYIKIAQQNAGKVPLGVPNYDTRWEHAIGGQLSYNSSTKIITAPSGFQIQGLLRL